MPQGLQLWGGSLLHSDEIMCFDLKRVSPFLKQRFGEKWGTAKMVVVFSFPFEPNPIGYSQKTQTHNVEKTKHGAPEDADSSSRHANEFANHPGLSLWNSLWRIFPLTQ